MSTLRCPYCHDVPSPQLAVCAGCLAPHHERCWDELGRCASCAAGRALRAQPTDPAAHPAGLGLRIAAGAFAVPLTL